MPRVMADPLSPLAGTSPLLSALQTPVMRLALTRRPGTVTRAARADLRGLEDALRTLRRGLERLQARAGRVRTLGDRSSGTAGPGRAVSSAPVTIEPVPTFTTLRSREEVNATPTSFTPFGPEVSGATSSLPTLGGVYDGDQGDDTLTFRFKDTRVLGEPGNVKVEVRDGNGDKIETLNFKNLPPDTPVELKNGVTLSLGEGFVIKNDTFEVQVFESIGSRVDPTQPFDGTRNENPNFEVGQRVSAGSFEVNGVVIEVADDDTLEAVLAKISASDADVEASFDAAAERVVLTRRTAGSEASITLGNDSSGFLAATKLAGATPVLGQDGEDPLGLPIEEVPELAGVTDGNLVVNGVPVAIETAADSVGDVLDRINLSEAGVTARFDPATLRLSITANDPGERVVLADETGFLQAFHIQPGSYGGKTVARSDGASRGFRDARAVLRELGEVRNAVNTIFRRGFGADAATLGSVRERLEAAVTATFESFLDGGAGSELRSELGLRFRFEDASRGVFRLDAARFERATRASFDELEAFLFQDERGEDGRGLVLSLLETVEALQGELAARRGASLLGRLIDLRA